MAGKGIDPEFDAQLNERMRLLCMNFSREINANFKKAKEVVDLEYQFVTGKPLFPELHGRKR